MRLTPKKTCEQIVESGNHYLGALKGNQAGLLREVKQHFQPQDTYSQVNKGHGRIEKRTVSICQTLDGIRPWAGLCTVIRVEATRHLLRDYLIVGSVQVRYYISSLNETAQQFALRIRSYWGVENKVHYVRDVTQGEDKSRIRVLPLPQLWTLARNFALNLYREQGLSNMAQAQRRSSFGLSTLAQLFRMK